MKRTSHYTLFITALALNASSLWAAQSQNSMNIMDDSAFFDLKSSHSVPANTKAEDAWGAPRSWKDIAVNKTLFDYDGSLANGLNSYLNAAKTPAEKLNAETAVDFTNMAYCANTSKWQDQGLYEKLVKSGWTIKQFSGTNGTAANRFESTTGVIGFNGNRVVISTRGTEATSLQDWITNLRCTRSNEQTTANYHYGVDGKIANGFLQGHLSSWDFIKNEIMTYARNQGIAPKDLQYTLVGHSQGGAKAQLNMMALLTDVDLGIGVTKLDQSFRTDTLLGMSGFYALGHKTDPKNNGNVNAMVFCAPRVFDGPLAKQVDEMTGKDNILRVENKKDLVPHVAPEMLGFKHAGTALPINTGLTPLDAHFMGNVASAGQKAIEDHIACKDAFESNDTSTVSNKMNSAPKPAESLDHTATTVKAKGGVFSSLWSSIKGVLGF